VMRVDFCFLYRAVPEQFLDVLQWYLSHNQISRIGVAEYVKEHPRTWECGGVKFGQYAALVWCPLWNRQSVTVR
jgi:hypothetical protein